MQKASKGKFTAKVETGTSRVTSLMGRIKPLEASKPEEFKMTDRDFRKGLKGPKS